MDLNILSKLTVNNAEKANTYLHSHLFRPPHGWMRLTQYARLRKKYRIVMWDLVTRDYSKWMTAEDVLNNVKDILEMALL